MKIVVGVQYRDTGLTYQGEAWKHEVTAPTIIKYIVKKNGEWMLLLCGFMSVWAHLLGWQVEQCERSDVNLAVWGGLPDKQYTPFLQKKTDSACHDVLLELDWITGTHVNITLDCFPLFP